MLKNAECNPECVGEFNAMRSMRAFLATAAVLALSSAFVSGTAAAAEKDKCQIVNGTISPLRTVSCPNYISCSEGEISGDLSGTFRSGLTSLHFDPMAGTWSFAALTTISDGSSKGVIYTNDVGTASGNFSNASEVMTITSGLKDYKKTGGYFNLSGGYLAGQPGTYQGQLCKEKEK